MNKVALNKFNYLTQDLKAVDELNQIIMQNI